jgi:hypothetical protein
MKQDQKQLFEIPVWIDSKAWEGFEEMRKKQKKPLTDRARNCIVNTLWRLREDEHQNADAILDQSTVNCWLDVYPIREKRNGNGRTAGHSKGYISPEQSAAILSQGMDETD